MPSLRITAEEAYDHPSLQERRPAIGVQGVGELDAIGRKEEVFRANRPTTTPRGSRVPLNLA